MHLASTIIRDVKIKGTLEFSESLFLDCQFEGEIISEGDLTIGEHANVHAEIQAKKLTVLGNVKGNVLVKESCKIKSSGVFIGDIKAQTFEISEGATFHGYAAVPFKPVFEQDFPSLKNESTPMPKRKKIPTQTQLETISRKDFSTISTQILSQQPK